VPGTTTGFGTSHDHAPYVGSSLLRGDRERRSLCYARKPLDSALPIKSSKVLARAASTQTHPPPHVPVQRTTDAAQTEKNHGPLTCEQQVLLCLGKTCSIEITDQIGQVHLLNLASSNHHAWTCLFAGSRHRQPTFASGLSKGKSKNRNAK